MTARQPCHLILLDPPYKSGMGQKALTRLAAKGWIADGAWISLETAKSETVDVAGFTVDAIRDHGKARLHLLRYAPPLAPDGVAIGRASGRVRVWQSV